MIFLDKPYVSDLLMSTIQKNAFPVLNTSQNGSLYPKGAIHSLESSDALQILETTDPVKLYTVSENSLDWIARHLDHTDLPEKIHLFKDKLQFRQLTASMYPDFKYLAVPAEQLESLDVESFAPPFVVKPAVGFFSLGVYPVADSTRWPGVIDRIRGDLETIQRFYPRQVLDASTFILEDYITGDEYAFDAYFDEQGEPVILGIFKHLFSSGEDVSDRVYTTSRDIIEPLIDPFTSFLKTLGRLAGLCCFPLHGEVRIDPQGRIRPIEINPLRFGGWCTTADLTAMALGFNPYEAFFNNVRPDWEALWATKSDTLFSIIVLDNSTGYSASQIQRFLADRLLSRFDRPLEFRPVDYNEYPVFGFLFAETRQTSCAELEAILHSDLTEFVEIHSSTQ
jgi:hypothetical protein